MERNEMRDGAVAWGRGMLWAMPGVAFFCLWRGSDGWIATTAAVLCCGYVATVIGLGLRAEAGSRLPGAVVDDGLERDSEQAGAAQRQQVRRERDDLSR